MTDKERGLAIVEAFRTSQFFEQHYGTTEEETESILNILTERCKDIYQEPCEDCISREQALKVFAEKCAGECACCEYNGSGYDTAENCKLIKSLPPVTPQPKTEWIPVNEGLPEENVEVLVTIWDAVEIARYTKEYGWEMLYEAGADYWQEIEDVTAWMPLPHPYTAESEG